MMHKLVIVFLIALSLAARADTLGKGCVVVIDAVRGYEIPKSHGTGLMSKLKTIIPWKPLGSDLLMPRQPEGMNLEVVEASGQSAERLVVPLKAGREFTLDPGIYRLSCPGYALTIEDRLSDSNRRLSVANSTLRVFSSSKGGSVKRHLTIYCYPLDTLVTVCGRVVDALGNGICGIELQGHPVTRDENDVMWHEQVFTKTDENGNFRFENLPPASLDLAVRFLLFGSVMKASFPSEKIFDFSISVKPHSSSLQTQRVRVSVPLISKRNLTDIRYLAERIRGTGVSQDESGIRFVDEKRPLAKLPDSTNNVVYVGDIVMEKNDRGTQKK